MNVGILIKEYKMEVALLDQMLTDNARQENLTRIGGAWHALEELSYKKDFINIQRQIYLKVTEDLKGL